jgi:hypothetical protein
MGKVKRNKNREPALNVVVNDAIEEIRESGRYVEVSLEHNTGTRTCALFNGFAYCIENDTVHLLKDGHGNIEKLPSMQIRGIEIVRYGLKHDYMPNVG